MVRVALHEAVRAHSAAAAAAAVVGQPHADGPIARGRDDVHHVVRKHGPVDKAGVMAGEDGETGAMVGWHATPPLSQISTAGKHLQKKKSSQSPSHTHAVKSAEADTSMAELAEKETWCTFPTVK
jgi:hypothetical protein